MITVGIDVGLENIKAAVMEDGAVVGRAEGLSGGAGRPQSVRAVYDAALADAGVNASDVDNVVSTGKGKFDAAFSSDKVSELMAASKAAFLLEPDATTVVDIGADEIIVATLGEASGGESGVKEFVTNQKCAAGLGLLLESMADRFDIAIGEFNALDGPSAVAVNDGCTVFAELDALSLINRGVELKEVMKALVEACAWRANSTLNDIYKQDTGKVVMFGGMAKNNTFVKALERISGIKFIIPDDAYYAGAIGAAALAASARN